MHTLLHFPLQDPCPSWFVVVGDFQNVGGIYIVVYSPPHNMIPLNIEFKHWDLENNSVRFHFCVEKDMGR